MKDKKIILILLFMLLSTLLYVYKTHVDFLKIGRTIFLSKQKSNAWNKLSERIKKEIADFGRETGLVIKDLKKGWQISYEQNKLFPSASLVKIPIMASCFYALEDGKINLEEKILLKTTHKVPGSGLLKNMSAGGEFTVEELIELMISESDNTAANMLIERLSYDYLNNSFKKLGLVNTNLSRRMMDFRNRKKGKENYTTAYDIAYLLEKIYRKELLSSNISKKCLELLKRQKIKDRIPAKLPLDTVIAHKTGLEKGICHDAGIVFTDKGDFLICVLTKYKDKTAKKAKNFIAQIAYLTYKYFKWGQTLFFL